MGKTYDIGLPIDLQDRIAKLADAVDAKITDVTHALIRDALVRISTSDEARQWWKQHKQRRYT